MKFTDDEPHAQKGNAGVDRSQGAARAISVRPAVRSAVQPLTSRQTFIDPGLSWKDLDWFKSITKS